MGDLPSTPPAPVAAAGPRPTRQRRALVALLFAGRDRHFTAEILHEEAGRTSESISLATIYNTLHRLSACGYLTKVVVSSRGTYFDTNIGDHHHFHLRGHGSAGGHALRASLRVGD